jgi:hypothetical protein
MLSTPLDFIEIYFDIFKNALGTNNSMNSHLISDIKILSINIMKNNIKRDIYLSNSSSQFHIYALTKL